MTEIDFITPVRREVSRLAPELGLVDAPEFCRSEYWFARMAYRTNTALLFFDCELTRGYGVDVLFGAVAKKEAKHSLHTFLRLHDQEAAAAFDSALPKNQTDLDDLLRLYAGALLKYRKEVLEETEMTVASMERDFIEKDFANQSFNP